MTVDEEMIILKDAIKTFGVVSQTDKAIEEMSELTKALLKYRIKPSQSHINDIREEITDCLIMLRQMILIYGINDEDLDIKLSRLVQRIEEHKENNDDADK